MSRRSENKSDYKSLIKHYSFFSLINRRTASKYDDDVILLRVLSEKGNVVPVKRTCTIMDCESNTDEFDHHVMSGIGTTPDWVRHLCASVVGWTFSCQWGALARHLPL